MVCTHCDRQQSASFLGGDFRGKVFKLAGQLSEPHTALLQGHERSAAESYLALRGIGLGSLFQAPLHLEVVETGRIRDIDEVPKLLRAGGRSSLNEQRREGLLFLGGEIDGHGLSHRASHIRIIEAQDPFEEKQKATLTWLDTLRKDHRQSLRAEVFST